MDPDTSTSTNSPHASKRPRTEDKDGTEPVVVLHSPDLWLSDGAIILRTSQRVKGSTGVTQTLYKVHKSTLAMHASFFRDLFDGPQTALETASEQYEGLPMMDMPDDAQDVDDFLKALYFPDHIHRHGRHSSGAPFWSTFPGMYRGTLRLAKKYDAPKIRQVIVDAVKKEWPTELRYWDKRQSVAQEDKVSILKSKLKHRVVYPEPAHTIRLAAEHGIPEVLPTAYYDLARVYEFNRTTDIHHHNANIRILCADELFKLITGMAALRNHIHKALVHTVNGCPDLDSCSFGQYSSTDSNSDDESEGYSQCTEPLLSWWRKQFEHLVKSGDPLGYLKTAGELVMCDGSLVNLVSSDAVCVGCRECVQGLIADKRDKLWKELPNLFNLRDRVDANWGS
ncbi:hypothetical protein OF83DRAFT_1292934 [Amylostereum chailletii]|nr:hypothetical protein OF83DRAFT_1292934 [Amylostereum chailletii]